MKLVSPNPEASLAAVRRLSENAINQPSRGLVTAKLTPFVAADAPDEDVEVFRYATLKNPPHPSPLPQGGEGEK